MNDELGSATFRLHILTERHEALGGTVDVLCRREFGEEVRLHGADAGRAIELHLPHRQVGERVEVRVTPVGGGRSETHHARLGAEGRETMNFFFDAKPVGSSTRTQPGEGGAATPPGKAGSTPPGHAGTYTVQGTLVFDYGLAAAGVAARAYDIGFGGAATLLGETKTDAGGTYRLSYQPPASGGVNLQMRVVGPTDTQTTISKTKFNALKLETLNLIVPGKVQPLKPEFTRLAADMQTHIGGVTRLGEAQENAKQRDLTLVNQTTAWDARLAAVGALAAQAAKTTGLGQDALYALYRAGLPTDVASLAKVPVETVQASLQAAADSGIVALSGSQVRDAVKSFTTFANTAQRASVTVGGLSTLSEMLNVHLEDETQQTAFLKLYSSNPTSPTLWTEAAQLGIPAKSLDALRVQGKFLYLTFNNQPLAAVLQTQMGESTQVSQLAAKDFHKPETWESAVQELATAENAPSLNDLIPSAYVGAATADRLAAYAGDMARRVRISFPTETTARLVESGDLAVPEATAPQVTAFLREAAQNGYSLGRTPLNTFLTRNKGKLASVDALDEDSLEAVKSMHRVFQVTPSTESMQVALKAGFTSARDIATINKGDFMNQYGPLFPTGEASWVWNQSQTTVAVTFNICSSAVQMDSQPPVYALSPAPEQKQAAKNALVQQFPSMASLFGNLDYCACDDCSSVLSPAAYFVDVLHLLEQCGKNTAGKTPLDVLIGAGQLAGRRPDLGALPLTCENTNTAMPYIDLVNEILEYFIANKALGPGCAYDTGTATTAELTAEPQNILPQVYDTTLKSALYPLNLPFDLWIETVRGFLLYFNTPLAQVLDTLRPADQLELFTDANHYPYYRAQIFAEALGLSPSDYAVITGTAAGLTPVTHNWFQLYGYTTEAAALAELKSAETLADALGVTSQQLTDLLSTGFVNPAMYPLIFNLERYGIEQSDAFIFTKQPGYTGKTVSTDFGEAVAVVNAKYAAANPGTSFNVEDWITSALPANSSNKILVLADPDSGCNFEATTLQYADNVTPASALDFVKLNLFVRLWKKLGWSMDEVDRALQAFFPANLPAWTDAAFDGAFTAAWRTALVYLAHLDALNTQLAPTLGRVALLPFWTTLSQVGATPLYATLFLTSSVLNNDAAFDDPSGAAASQPLANHLSSVQGVLGLTSDEVTEILADAGALTDKVTIVQGGQNVSVPAFTLNNLSICYRYSALAKCLSLTVEDTIALKAMSGLNPFEATSGVAITTLAEDVLFGNTLAFVQQVGVVQKSGFSVDDLQYLLRHQFDPVGEYQVDVNGLLTLLQATAAGLAQIAGQNAVPATLDSTPEAQLDQILSGLFPSAVLKSLFALLTGAKDLSASSPAGSTQIDPTPFAAETELSFSYDAPTQVQTVTISGLLLDWKKAELLAIFSSPEFSTILDGVQAQSNVVFGKSLSDVLGVWASLTEYEASTAATPAQAIDPTTAASLMAADPALSLSYDEVDNLQWAGYRGVLTSVKAAVLTAVPLANAAETSTLAALVSALQAQTLPMYSQLASSLLAMLVNGQTFAATATGVAAADQVDLAGFSSALSAAQQGGTISVPAPALQFAYDAVSQTETLTCTGVLTDALRSQLAALPGVNATCTGLLQAVRNGMTGLFQTLATGLVTVAATDLDTFARPYLGLDRTKAQIQAKAQLIQVFLPLEAAKLSRQFVLQTLALNLNADPSLTEALVIDTALLSDPSSPGNSLLGSFLALGVPGVSATFTPAAGSPVTGTAGTVDTTDPVNTIAAAALASAHFEGYLQVPTDGPYRFFAEVGDTGATARLQIDAPPAWALLSNPILAPTPAPADNNETSQFVTLQASAFYHFTVDFTGLGARGARLLVQGENLPKGPLSELVLCPQDAANAFLRARTLLAKVLQILETTGLDERELNYLVANAEQFQQLRFSSLPSQTADDSTAKAVVLFAQMLMVMDYADLRANLAGGTDGLVGVFQSVSAPLPALVSGSTPPLTAWASLAALTRRHASDVEAVATYFGLIQGGKAVGDFANNKGIRRIWQALQLLQMMAIPVAAVLNSTAIASAPGAVPPSQIATGLKNAVKAQYTLDQWLPIAQSVFDPLRQKKRDALVTYLVSSPSSPVSLADENALFEYFLVDPGMEPVVQTSRLRLAMSSVQTFVQRCLLNLENANSNVAMNVSPSVIDSDWWEWMKRYRVWQANREIFLYPENWMEPELRLDMTDLFEQLESDLLQGDVTNDLANDAFLKYLTSLEQRSRLDVVATYFDQDMTSASNSTLHVLARTYGHPHKYFYRTYASSSWDGWVPVTPDIAGDHIALAFWKGRLNLFWVTFIQQQQAQAKPSGSNSGDPAAASLGFGDLVDAVYSGAPVQTVLAQLHWCEFYQGKWSNPIHSDTRQSAPVAVTTGMDVNQISLRVNKEVNESGGEGALKILLDFPWQQALDPKYMELLETAALTDTLGVLFGATAIPVPLPTWSFRITSKNCDLVLNADFYNVAPTNPYNTTGVDATVFTGTGTLKFTFENGFNDENGAGTSQTTEPILQTVSDYALVPCANPVSASPFITSADPYAPQAGALVSPFFYKDRANQTTTDEMSFYVQPRMTETTITDWLTWAVPDPPRGGVWGQGRTPIQTISAAVPLLNPGLLAQISSEYAVFAPATSKDWLTSGSAQISYQGAAVGKMGAAFNPSTAQAGATQKQRNTDTNAQDGTTNLQQQQERAR